MTPDLRFHRSTWFRYGAAIVITGIALALKLLLVRWMTEDSPFLLFFAAVMGAAIIGGLGPGLVATALVALYNTYFFMRPFGQLATGGLDQQLRIVLFIAESALVCVICARLQSARKRVEAAADEARDLERQILERDDEEQRRIGHDLHDGLGQTLTGIAMMARRLEQRLAASNSPEAPDARQVSDLARSAVEVTHDLCRTLSPPALESAGLAEALRELAANAESLFRIECRFEPNGDVDIRDLASGVHLYRIAQEAISNAVKHGKAQRITLRLDASGPNISMQVADDGTGIDPVARSIEGMGLRIMQYRARLIGATIEVKHQDQGGTAVICRFHRPTGFTKSDATKSETARGSGRTAGMRDAAIRDIHGNL